MDDSWFALIVGFVVFIIVGVIAVYYFAPHTPQQEPTKVQQTPSQSAPITQQGNASLPLPLVIAPAPAPPPLCFSPTTVSANNIIKVITQYGLQGKYAALIMAYSIVVCVFNTGTNTKCTDITTALNRLIMLGASPNSVSGATELSYYTAIPANTLMRSFLVAAMDIISNYVAALVNDNALSESDRSSVRGFNYEFCRNYMDPIAKAGCS